MKKSKFSRDSIQDCRIMLPFVIRTVEGGKVRETRNRKAEKHQEAFRPSSDGDRKKIGNEISALESPTLQLSVGDFFT